ncbi:unnamed protein product [Clavelina lepadiformis]|uniref:Uncharacterized protein n=1 Tax=Clavelina lepadiformis TaxID=159417 RepID=A0ABP0GXQ8_CLALP
MQPKAGGKLHLRLNTVARPIANKYREGKLKSTLKRELKTAAGLIAAESRTLTGRIPPVHGRGQRTSAGREPRPAGRRSEGRAQGNSPSGECYRRAIVRPAVRPRRDRRVWCLRVPGRPCRAGSRPAGDCSQCPAVGALLRCGVVARGARGPRLMSATFPTRLETRTKESNMCASRGAVRNPQGVVKANAGVVRRRSPTRLIGAGRRMRVPSGPLLTAGRWPWKSESAKECVTTHLPNQSALKMDGAGASGLYPAVAAVRARTGALCGDE